MDKQAAVKIIRDTLEKSFDKGRFINFGKNLVNYLDTSKNFIYRGNLIPDAYERSIQSLERVGKYEDAEDNKIDVLIVRLKKEHSLERARTMQRNFIAWYLNGSRGGDLKDAALAAFVSPDDRDWRFSLVKMDYNLVEAPSGKIKVETELTPARRYSFLVGENESSHTAQVQLLPILENDKTNPLLSNLEKAFSIEVVTKEFFNKYRELFLDVKESLEAIVKKDGKIREDFTAKGVDTVDFSKKLLGQIVFLYFLQKKGWFGVGRDEDWGAGPKNFLRLLFEKKIVTYQNFFNDVLEPLFYEALAIERAHDFSSHFNCKIPFLNGGLFDPINDYDWGHTDILLPNELFSNGHKTKEGDVGTGILDVFDRYNFTVKEDEPLDKEVAVDPEMLGKVFENLLEVKDRKSKGTYYTPREIVHYMCQESLINYLDTAVNTGEVPLVQTRPPQGKLFGKPDPEQTTFKTPSYRALVPREHIEAFVRMGELAIEHDTRVEIAGRETRDYSYKLPPNIRLNAALIDDKLASIRVCDPAIGSGAFPVGLMSEIVRARNTLTTYFADKEGRTNYSFKRDCIQDCLYGVDIDPGAVEIAKLRLWLSLVVDEDDIKQIQPLPNLDYKIVCGNSLLGVQRDMFNNQLFEKLEELKPLYFNETSTKKKHDCKQRIDWLITQLTDNNRTFDFEVYFSEVFHEKGGFDVIIANPPYISYYARESKKIEPEYKKRLGELYGKETGGSQNSFLQFIMKGLRVNRKHGCLCYIVPDAFMINERYRTIRQRLVSDATLISVLQTTFPTFEQYVRSCIPIIKNERSVGYSCTVFIADSIRQLEAKLFPRAFIVQQEDFLRDPDCRFLPKISILKRLPPTITLSGICRIKDGINPGMSALGLRPRLFLDSKRGTNPKKLIEGKNITRYRVCWTGRWVNYDPLLLTREAKKGGASLRDETIFTQEQKLVSRQTANRLVFALDDKQFYTTNSVHNTFITTSEPYSLKFILGILNSKFMGYIYRTLSGETRDIFPQVHISMLKELPIRVVNFENPTERQKHDEIVSLVNQLIELNLCLNSNVSQTPNNELSDRIQEIDNRIDREIHELYDLNAEAIELIESYWKECSNDEWKVRHK